MPETDTKGSPVAGQTGSTTGGEQANQKTGVIPEEYSKKIAEIEAQLKTKTEEATHWSKVAGQQSVEVNEGRQFREKYGRYQTDIDTYLASKDKQVMVQKRVENLRNTLGDEATTELLGIMDNVRQEDYQSYQAQLSALGEKLLLLEKPEYKNVAKIVDKIKAEIKANPNKASDVLYQAALAETIPQLIEEERKKITVETEERLKKEMAANQTGGFTAPPAMTPEEESDIQKAKDEILAFSKPKNPLLGL